MTTAVTSQPPTCIDVEPVPVPASTLLHVVMRVAGPVPIDVYPHALGHPRATGHRPHR